MIETSGKQATLPQVVHTKCGCSAESWAVCASEPSKRQTRSPSSTRRASPALARSVRFRYSVARSQGSPASESTTSAWLTGLLARRSSRKTAMREAVARSPAVRIASRIDVPAIGVQYLSSQLQLQLQSPRACLCGQSSARSPPLSALGAAPVRRVKALGYRPLTESHMSSAPACAMQRAAPPARGMNSSRFTPVDWVAIAFGATLFAVSTASAPSFYVGDGAPLVLGLAVVLAALLRWLLLAEAPIAAFFVVVYGLAYFVGAQKPLDLGFRSDSLAVLPEYVVEGLAVSVAFLVTSSLLILLLRRVGFSTAIARHVNSLTALAGPLPALSTFLLIFASSAVVSAGTGHLSYYGSTPEGAESGGFRLELLYSSLLFATVVVSVSQVLRGWFKEEHVKQRWLWGIMSLGSFALMFVLQSRRLMIASLGLPLMLHLPALRRAVASTPATRLLYVGSGLAAAGLLSVWASFYWRTADRDQALLDRASQATLLAVDASAENQGVVTSSLSRFTYLWLDSAALQYFPDGGAEGDLADAAMVSLAGATPAVLFPDKYRVSGPARCEHYFLRLNVKEDLPCTPAAEGWLLGGVLGLLVVSVCWSVAIAIGEAVMVSGRPDALALGALFISHFVTIETGAFPEAVALRDTLIVALPCAALGFVLWIARVDAPRRPRPGTS